MEELIAKLPRNIIVDNWNHNIFNLPENGKTINLRIIPIFEKYWAVQYWNNQTQKVVMSIERENLCEAIEVMLKFIEKHDLFKNASNIEI